MRWSKGKPLSNLKPKKPLKRTPLKRSQKPIKRKPIKRRVKTDGALVKSRKLVAERCQGVCEARLEVCTGQAEAVHHVLRRSQGGGHDPSNLLALCTACHQYVHANPAEAVSKGLLRKSEK